MKSVADRLPDRFPVGTRYVIEGRRAPGGDLHICSRFVVYPDGKRVVLPSDSTGRKPQLVGDAANDENLHVWFLIAMCCQKCASSMSERLDCTEKQDAFCCATI